VKGSFRIGTRGSALALCQANWVKTCLEQAYPDIRFHLVTIKTTGDSILGVPLAKVGGKGLFVKEIEEALLQREIDLAVHSMKDVPAQLPEGLKLGATTKRENPCDVLLTWSQKRLEALPLKSRIGTSSLRRQAQLLESRPDLRIESLRGNLDTRIKKLQSRIVDGIVVAAAGVIRMGWKNQITEYLSPTQIIPAIGQGALAIETGEDDWETNELIAFLHHEETGQTVAAERSFLKRLEGDCQIPIAALGVINDGKLTLSGMIGSLDGNLIVRDCGEDRAENAEKLGADLAEKLLAAGGRALLEERYGKAIVSRKGDS
jgi:hydroxymethylbilane synthase